MKYLMLVPIIFLSACNYMHLKPESMERDTIVYADRGGYSLKRAIKERLEGRGYDVRVGMIRSSSAIDGGGDLGDGISIKNVVISADTKYVIIVQERSESVAPIWCFFNGYWWWNFNVSIADQKTGEELLAWSGRGCANSTLRKLDRALNRLEK